MKLILIAVVAVVAAAACTGATNSAPRAEAQGVPKFRHVIVVVFENHEYDEVIGNSDAPTFNRLASRYASMTQYTGITHPSLPNYLALVSGSTWGIDSDCTDCIVRSRSLTDSLAAAKKTWKTYAEGLPSVGFTGAKRGRYAKKHNPFVYFRGNLTRPRLQRVVPFTQFRRDLRRRRLPTFSLVVPDLCHDMHDCGVATGDAWLARFLRPLLNGSALTKSVVFVTFDEGESDRGGGGRIATVAVGPLVRPGAQSAVPTNHYGLLRTIEDGLRLPRLGRSATAKPIVGIWR